MDLERVGVKFFCDAGEAVELGELIPVFHRWIQTNALGRLLIDVADYSHMTEGPGVILVGHEGIYAMDETGGRRGLVYYVRRPVDGSLTEHLIGTTHSALTACRLLEEAPELDGRLTFRGNELLVFANDRLHAPNNEATRKSIDGPLTALLDKLYAGADPQVEAQTEDRDRFSLAVKIADDVDVATLLGRL